MRLTLRLLAKVNPARYLEPNAPTGLTGLITHPSPRPALISLYNSTLEKLKALPESSVYRQSTEALTQQRLKIVESAKPPCFDEWLARVKSVIAEDPERYKAALQPDGSYSTILRDTAEVHGKEWDGEPFDPKVEGGYRSEEEMAQLEQESYEDAKRVEQPRVHWETEPPLEAAQYVQSGRAHFLSLIC
jgi:hypothetical protein